VFSKCYTNHPIFYKFPKPILDYFQLFKKNGLDFANDIEPLIPPLVIYTYKEGYLEGESPGGRFFLVSNLTPVISMLFGIDILSNLGIPIGVVKNIPISSAYTLEIGYIRG